MWELLTGLKDFIIGLSSEFTAKGIPAVTNKDIVLGTVDLSRYENKVLVSILPETSEDSDKYDFNDGAAIQQEITVSFLLRGVTYDSLIERMSKYSEIFTNAVRKDCTLDGLVEGSGLGATKFFCDAGAVEKQMTASETSLTLLYVKHF